MPTDIKTYQTEHRRKRKQMALDYLGGACVECGSTDNLQFDHIDPDTKSFIITGNLTLKWETLRSELDKCQLLCKTHHKTKTEGERLAHGGAFPKNVAQPRRVTKKRPLRVEHGGGTQGKLGCNCTPCVERRREYSRNYQRALREKYKKALALVADAPTVGTVTL